MTLNQDDVATALQSLPGWTYADGGLVRSVHVTPDSRDGLIAALGHAVEQHPSDAEVHVQPDVVMVRVGSDRGVTAEHVEIAARIDQVLDGSSRDLGTPRRTG
jgi:hypothetical protein